MRVVIFGGSGMLGQALRRAFSDAELFAPSRAEVDITDAPRLREYLFALRPDCVINAAAYTRTDQGRREGYLKAMAVNGWAVGALARVAKLLGATFIHFSTNEVFAADGTRAFSEEDPPGPVERLSLGGRSRFLGEKLLVREGGKFYLVRTAGLFGRRDGGIVSVKNFVDAVLAEARDTLFLRAADGTLGAVSYAADVARAVRDLWDDAPKSGFWRGGSARKSLDFLADEGASATEESAATDERAPWGVYHFVNEGAVNPYQLAKAVVALSGRGAIVRPAAVAWSTAIAESRAALLLNTKRPKLRSWQEAVAEYLKQIKN